MDGLGEAVSRFNQHEPEAPPEETEQQPAESSGGKGHSFHVHKHKDGKHHLMVHGDNGQLTHHSEHGSLEEAADEMKNHGEEGGGDDWGGEK